MLPSFCKDTITVLRAATVSSRGSTVLDWSNPTSTTVTGCSVQPSASTRDFDGRVVQVSEDWTLYAPVGSAIDAGDRVVWNGATFEVDGAPMPWTSPTGRVSHMWARLREWRG